MADNYNISTSQGQANEAEGLEQSNPAMTYVDFANQLTKNDQAQQEQAALIQQAQLLNKQKQAAAAAGINPATKGYMSKDEAMALIQAELSRQKLLSDDVKAQLQQWYDAAPDMVEQQDVKDFISRYQPKEAKAGAPFVATATDAADTDKTDETGKPLIEGQMYSVVTDAKGNVTYERGGQEKQSGSEDKDAKTIQKSKSDLVKELTKEVHASRGNWLSRGLYQASIAMQKLQSTPNMTAQDLYQVALDMSALFSGGVPTEYEITKVEYGTQLGSIMQSIGSWTGKIFGLPLQDIRAKLLSVIQSLYQELFHRFSSLVDLIAQGHLDAITADPEWWATTKQAVLTAAEHNQTSNPSMTEGNLFPIGNATPPAAPTTPAPATGGPDISALASALGLKKKVQ